MSGIYIHIPFCKQACHYCDFHFSTSMAKKDLMVSALQTELELRKDEFKGEIVETIYFGGGTPSVLTSEEINQVIETVNENYKVAENPEITLEANPDDLTNVTLSARLNDMVGQAVEGPITNIFEEYLKGGINRLSIGIQSFFEEDLKLMNRAHSAQEAEESLSLATRQFENISIDLIYGIPEMSNDRWKQNIEKALSFNIPHISSYALTVEPKTALDYMIKKGQIQNVDDGQAHNQYDILTIMLEKAGYACYEISNFGKEGYFSKNNTAYWQGKKYIGIGPSAHSFDGQRRGWNIRNNSKYLKSIQEGRLPMETEILTTIDRYNEYIMTGLRTIWGVSLEKIVSEYGEKHLNYLIKQSSKPIEQKLLVLDGDTLKVTKKGKFLADGLASDLFMLNLD